MLARPMELSPDCFSVLRKGESKIVEQALRTRARGSLRGEKNVARVSVRMAGRLG